jgi:hypothetical protein
VFPKESSASAFLGDAQKKQPLKQLEVTCFDAGKVLHSLQQLLVCLFASSMHTAAGI